jgi:hypothetical protein
MILCPSLNTKHFKNGRGRRPPSTALESYLVERGLGTNCYNPVDDEQKPNAQGLRDKVVIPNYFQPKVGRTVPCALAQRRTLLYSAQCSSAFCQAMQRGGRSLRVRGLGSALAGQLGFAAGPSEIWGLTAQASSQRSSSC